MLGLFVMHCVTISLLIFTNRKKNILSLLTIDAAEQKMFRMFLLKGGLVRAIIQLLWFMFTHIFLSFKPNEL